MSRIITHADIAALPDGSILDVPEDAQLTPLAEERARARGITLRRGPDTAALVQAVTEQVMARLGAFHAGDVERITQEVLAALSSEGARQPGSLDYCAAYLEAERARARRRAIITTTGRNAPGIVARLTTEIARLGGDILDISQTLVAEYFTMILVVDTAALSCDFAAFKAHIEATCHQMAIQCMVMHEDVLTSLSRV
ncbi:MAG: ACT domain-containing protein [Myxococcales bacterium]|nr:hypothetical protein [Myxococcota bacterium]MDW8281589.1 ACT domain-containing protein [Myxococcales bacterium]